MGAHGHSVTALPVVAARLDYLKRDGRRPVNYTFEPPPGTPWFSGTHEAHVLPIQDARPDVDGFSLEEHGFALLPHASSVVDFYDDEEVRGVYYGEAQRLIAEATGAVRVVVFDHLVRRRDAAKPPLTFGRSQTNGVRGPVGRVHADFTARSAPNRLRLEVGAEAEPLLRHRFAQINVWRAIRGPLLDAPLALLDGRTVVPDDLIATDLVYPNRVGETYSVAYNRNHHWFYFRAMQPDEALLFKNFDSAVDGRARVAPHTAFEDPSAPADAAPRESIELRAFAFFPELTS